MNNRGNSSTLLIAFIVLVLIGVGIGVVWYTGNLPGTDKYEKKKYIMDEVIPMLKKIEYNSNNKPSIEDINNVRLLCDRNIDMASIPSKHKRV